jgi:hypothetical protein
MNIDPMDRRTAEDVIYTDLIVKPRGEGGISSPIHHVNFAKYLGNLNEKEPWLTIRVQADVTKVLRSADDPYNQTHSAYLSGKFFLRVIAAKLAKDPKCQ